MVTRYNLFYTVVADVVRSALLPYTTVQLLPWNFRKYKLNARKMKILIKVLPLEIIFFLSILPQKGVRNLQKSWK
jgi:hypothetical protein